MKSRRSTGVKARTSREDRNPPYPFVLSWNLPEAAEVFAASEVMIWGEEGVFDYKVVMTPGTKKLRPEKWATPPHEAFANLRVVEDHKLRIEIPDRHRMPNFLLQYGQLGSSSELETVEKTSMVIDDKGMPIDLDKKSCEMLASSRSPALIRHVWGTGSEFAIEALATSGEKGSRIRIDPKTGAATPEFLTSWSLICYLTVKDQRRGRLGFCANPECGAPYFLKTRRTQKICDQPGCSAWAQRNYALKWWHENNRKPKAK
jgi:hypothetical protein